MVETLARNTSGEMLWYSRRGESVTRAVGMRMGCEGWEIYIKKTQKCLPECGGAEGAWTRCPLGLLGWGLVIGRLESMGGGWDHWEFVLDMENFSAVGYHSEATPSSLDLLRGLICHWMNHVNLPGAYLSHGGVTSFIASVLVYMAHAPKAFFPLSWMAVGHCHHWWANTPTPLSKGGIPSSQSSGNKIFLVPWHPFSPFTHVPLLRSLQGSHWGTNVLVWRSFLFLWSLWRTGVASPWRKLL